METYEKNVTIQHTTTIHTAAFRQQAKKSSCTMCHAGHSKGRQNLQLKLQPCSCLADWF